ncbi:preprotein translocase subunit SecA [Candidatus Curtissbacteria bacterium RIFCSPLOWO2_01_FULL_39_62]|uniref:Protein translocase subunit SecA n=1 Tax=Candidatus Curtissbacteria bacterium RIFCSPHIGHO2_02_FULL_40_16b TaxID=1797714 RepID=A0A1F5GBW1_9BACT|nr:MAG: preprotein translocase subunit SecA [Candidatus Curtissbacteria bacterium RIFCSPHIGHO2_01_FULL_39_57]OGD89362.1 MAG: preprotein translocase subunit SecA [Candidatus Curtissbacteria bacterium RIFCSPHIGHO2_02_FULL_40_16b]OGE02731.1 MAG: preprotein translocase subunit SecA [Candidatus Curtissbacteria bacterium RIFCSPLOWO2_01_FULL_39_62]
MFGILNKFLDSNEKQINKLQSLIDEVASFEKKVQKLTDGKLKAKTAEFKLRFERGATLDELLPEAYAVVREASKRTLGQRHFDVQIMAGIVLHQGKIAEQRTGEGKTLTASLPLYLNSLSAKGVHLATVNDYLARVGLGWMGPIYSALGVSAGCIMQEKAFIYDPKFEDKNQFDWRLRHLKPIDKKEAYLADITYGTNNEFGFDYLRDNMVWALSDKAQRSHHFSIVDEADSILIDEARTPLIISAPAAQATDKYFQFAKLVNELSADTDYVIDEKLKTANLTEHGISKVEKRLGVANLYEKDFGTIHHIQQALRARTLYHKDKDYVVKDGEIIIVDEFTGRLMQGRRWSEGLHQAIEAKEGVEIQKESQTLATISFQNYFRLYEKLAGMTGTAATEAEEFHKIYGVEVIVIPTNKPMIRKDTSDVVYKTAKAKFTAVANEVAERNKKGQPVLIGTTSIEKNDFLAALLKRKGIKHEALNAKNHQREAEIIAQAGTKSTVTLATNIAGRGVDVILGGIPPTDKLGRPDMKGKDFEKWQKNHDEIIELGGLHIVGTERHEARRIDNQLRGRSGRQGDPGSSKFYVSLEDEIMRLFGGEQIANIMTSFKLPEDTPIEHGMVSKAIENAQVKVETHNFDIRKHLVEYDDVANKQREIIYQRRNEILEAAQDEKKANKIKDEILDKIHVEIENLVAMHSPEGISQPKHEKIIKEFTTIVSFDESSEQALLVDAQKIKDPDKLSAFLENIIDKLYEERNKSLGEKQARDIEKFVSLSVIDTLWIQHLDSLDDLREGIGLRAAGQRDPLVEYKQEAYSMFEKLVANIDYDIVHRIFKVQVRREPAIEKLEEQGIEVHPQAQLQGATQEQDKSRVQKPNGPTLQSTAEKDPKQMTDNELDAEIARLEELQSKGDQPEGKVSSQFSNPFDATSKPIKVTKIGRNDPCPCGSGLKWKKCGLIDAPEHKR